MICVDHARASDDLELTQALERALVELKALEDRNACLSDDLAISRREQDRLHQQLRAHDRQHAEDQNRIDALLDNIQQKPNAIQQSSATQEGKPMIRVKEYNILCECIERGINVGYQHAHKHTDTPTRDLMFAEMYKAIMNEISDYFIFEEHQ